jgi:hypothetical protein
MKANPLGLITYHLFRVIGLGDCAPDFFVGRKLRWRVISGPGLLCMIDYTTISHVFMSNCDILILPSCEIFSGHALYQTTIKNCRLERLALCMHEDQWPKVKHGFLGKPNLVHASPELIPAQARELLG